MSTNKTPLTLIPTAETAGVLLHLEIWRAQLWILMPRVLGELSRLKEGNEFKQCVDLYEYLPCVETLGAEEGGKENGTFPGSTLNQTSVVFWLLLCCAFACFSLCFGFVLFQSMPSHQNLLYLFHPPQSNISPPQVLWMVLWHSRWSHTEDAGPVPEKAYGSGGLMDNG